MSVRKRWILGFGIWTALAILSASQQVVRLAAQNIPIQWYQLIVGNLASWYSCAIFTPLFFWAARRFPIDPRDGLRHLPLHLGLCAVASALKFVVEWTATRQLLGVGSGPLGRMLSFGFISENIAFWCMTAAIHAIEFQRRERERELLSARLQARLSEAQLSALSARLHPHFLFNTLQGISTLVHRDPQAADAMLGRLSTLLRKTLHAHPGHEVTVEEELTVLEDYLAIAQTRFGDRLMIERDIDPGARSALLPYLSLQPLLENAFEHGIARRAGAGRVAIAARRVSDNLELTVRDDGYGPAADGMREGVGLGTTRARLVELYGRGSSLTLAGHADGGTIATMVLPFHEAKIVPASAAEVPG